MYTNLTLQARPSFSFDGVYTQNPQDRSGTGSALADFILGYTSASQLSTESVSNTRQRVYQAYVQDEWRVNSRLGLSLGVRYELPMPFYETSENYADAILEPGPYYGQLLNAHALTGTGYTNSFSKANYHNLAPRIGFAMKLTDKTYIRSVFGVFYGADDNLDFARRPTNNPPYFVLRTYISDQIDPGIILSQGFPANALNPFVTLPTVTSFLQHSPTPYTQQWTFILRREIGSGFYAQLQYTGSNAHDIYYPAQIDTPTPGPGDIQARRPLSQFSGVYEYGPFVSSTYHALNARLQRNLSKGFTLQADYVWSHSIDNGVTDLNGYGFAPEDPNDFAAERGNSNFDVRQRFGLSLLYELPLGRDKRLLSHSRFLEAALEGWQLGAIFSAQSGLPFTPVLSFDNTNTGTLARPDRLSSGVLPSDQRGPQNWFNEAAFVAPSAYGYGNSGRNVLRGPGFQNLAVELGRKFAMSERFNLEFRAEAYNIMNTPELGLPNAVLGVATTGSITTVAGTQREIQLILRLRF